MPCFVSGAVLNHGHCPSVTAVPFQLKVQTESLIRSDDSKLLSRPTCSALCDVSCCRNGRQVAKDFFNWELTQWALDDWSQHSQRPTSAPYFRKSAVRCARVKQTFSVTVVQNHRQGVSGVLQQNLPSKHRTVLVFTPITEQCHMLIHKLWQTPERKYLTSPPSLPTITPRPNMFFLILIRF